MTNTQFLDESVPNLERERLLRKYTRDDIIAGLKLAAAADTKARGISYGLLEVYIIKVRQLAAAELRDMYDKSLNQ